MKTIAQIVLTFALSLGATVGLNANARGKAVQVLQRVEGIVSQAADFGMQTASNASANASVQASTNVGASVSSQARSSASASGNAESGANLGTMLKGLFKGQTNAGASAQTSTSAAGNGSLWNLIFGVQSNANTGFNLGQ